MFHSLSLKTKLLTGFGVVLALLLVVVGIYHFALSLSVKDYSGLINQELAIEQHAMEAESHMLQCRRNEKDFLLRLDKKYVPDFRDNLAAVVMNAKHSRFGSTGRPSGAGGDGQGNQASLRAV